MSSAYLSTESKHGRKLCDIFFYSLSGSCHGHESYIFRVFFNNGTIPTKPSPIIKVFQDQEISQLTGRTKIVLHN